MNKDNYAKAYYVRAIESSPIDECSDPGSQNYTNCLNEVLHDFIAFNYALIQKSIHRQF